jgi:D-beta-D-heptose 7-phosphate kinase/D-beta-D-heptose 1-phosphate adenosyltransferase
VSKVLVIGDGCKDVFRYGKCDRLSPEAPVPVFKPLGDKSNGGMAVNVYANLLALGIDADIHTYSGITKTRYVDEVSNQMLLRVDENDMIFVGPNIYDRQMAFDYSQYEAIVISDYDKGFISEEVIEHIANSHPLVFMDTKKDFGHWCDKVFCVKINEKEFLKNKQWLDFQYSNILVVTLGKKGAMYSHNKVGIFDYQEILNEDDEHPVRDLSGAGDTFLAALVADYMKNKDISKAIQFANKCAAWVVTQKGVVVVDLNKAKL